MPPGEISASRPQPVGRAKVFWRGLALACPNCGGRGIHRSWFELRACCPRCGMSLRRDEGARLGSMSLSYFATCAALIPVLVFWLRGSLPGVWAAVLAAAVGVGFPVAFQPMARSYWLLCYYFFLPFELPANRRGEPVEPAEELELRGG